MSCLHDTVTGTALLPSTFLLISHLISDKLLAQQNKLNIENQAASVTLAMLQLCCAETLEASTLLELDNLFIFQLSSSYCFGVVALQGFGVKIIS